MWGHGGTVRQGPGPNAYLCVCACLYIYCCIHVLVKSHLLSVCMLLCENMRTHVCVKKESSAAEHSGNWRGLSNTNTQRHGPHRRTNAGAEGLKQQPSECPARTRENNPQSPVDSNSQSPKHTVYDSMKSRHHTPAQISEPQTISDLALTEWT